MIKHYKRAKLQFKEWVVESAKSRNAVWVLGAMSFLESVISPIPSDVFLMPMAAVRPKRWPYFAAVATITSVLGAIFGYLIGLGLFDAVAQPLVDFYNLQDQVVRVGEFMNQSAFAAIFVGAFTPIPFKVFTLTAGFFKIKIIPFIVAGLIGRGFRYVLVSWLMARFGESMAKTVYRYLSLFTLLAVSIIILYVFLV